MKEIYFKGSKIFEFKDENAIQIIGNNTYLISLIIDIYDKIFSGYKFSDIDIEAMNGYYPEVKKDGKSLKKNDINLIRLTNISDIIDHLTITKSSILMKSILSFKDNIEINKSLLNVEKNLTELSIIIDMLLEDKLEKGELSIKSDICNMNFDNIFKNFFSVHFENNRDERISSWLLQEKESIDLFINLIKLLIESKEDITLIIDRLDSKISIANYRILLESLYKLTEKNSNFKIWIIPSRKEGVLLNYNIFQNTYIIKDNTIKLGDFEITYESISRNYPDNILPTRSEVVESLLQVLPFYNSEDLYLPTKEVIIMLIFLNLLGEENNIKIKDIQLSQLEKNFLTSLC